MSTNREILTYLIGYSTYLPVVIVYIVGIIIALNRWKRHPKISMLTLFGLGGQLILFFINMAINAWASFALFREWSSGQIATFYTVKGIITALIEAGFWVMLLYAIFALRGEQGRLPQANYRQPAPPTASA